LQQPDARQDRGQGFEGRASVDGDDGSGDQPAHGYRQRRREIARSSRESAEQCRSCTTITAGRHEGCEGCSWPQISSVNQPGSLNTVLRCLCHACPNWPCKATAKQLSPEAIGCAAHSQQSPPMPLTCSGPAVDKRWPHHRFVGGEQQQRDDGKRQLHGLENVDPLVEDVQLHG
jgi:hypothetical protein